MKKIHLLILLFILSSITGVRAQLYFCGNYSDAGEPMEVSDRFNLGEKGGYVYMLFSNNKRIIRAKTLNVVITRLSDKNYLQYDKKPMEVQDKKNWAIIDYHFTEDGNYKVSIQENNGHELAKNFVSVALKNEKTTVAFDQSPDESYYNATLIFCKSVDDGNPIESSHNFTAGEIYLYLKNDKKLASDSMTVKYFRHAPGSSSYEPYDVKRYGINGKYDYTYFPVAFSDPGEYSVEIYNSKYAKMVTGHVTISALHADENYYKSKITFYDSEKDGEFSGENTSFKAGNVYIYFKNEGIMGTDSISVMVYKRKDGSKSYDQYYDFKKYGVVAKNKATWFTWDFMDSGEYSIEIYNHDFYKMGTAYITITSSVQKDPDKSYYNARMIFCDKVEDGFEKNIGTKFRQGEVFIFVRNDKALETDSIIVDVHKKGFQTDQFNIFVDSKNYGISATGTATYISWVFKESGQYKVAVFNRRQQKITEGIVTIR